MKLPPTLSYHLMEQIRTLVIDGTYKPGQRLREQELEGRFEASRSPIREALRLLEIKGLVIHVPRRGFRVRQMTVKEISDLYHLRAELEAYSVRLLTGHKDLSLLIDALHEINSGMATALKEKDVDTYLRQNGLFHAEILNFSKNVPLAFTLEQVNQIAQPLRHNVLVRDMTSSSSLHYHREITTALIDKRIDVAEELMREHVLVSLPGVLKSYECLVREAHDRAAI